MSAASPRCRRTPQIMKRTHGRSAQPITGSTVKKTKQQPSSWLSKPKLVITPGRQPEELSLSQSHCCWFESPSGLIWINKQWAVTQRVDHHELVINETRFSRFSSRNNLNRTENETELLQTSKNNISFIQFGADKDWTSEWFLQSLCFFSKPSVISSFSLRLMKTHWNDPPIKDHYILYFTTHHNSWMKGQLSKNCCCTLVPNWSLRSTSSHESPADTAEFSFTWNSVKLCKKKKERKKTGAGVEINFKSIEPHISIDLNAMKMAEGGAVSSPLTWCSCFYFHSCFNQLALKVRPTPEDWRTTALEVTWLNDLQSQWRSSINQSEFEFALATPRPLG